MTALVWLIQMRARDPSAVPQRLMYAVEKMGMEVIADDYVPYRQDSTRRSCRPTGP